MEMLASSYLIRRNREIVWLPLTSVEFWFTRVLQIVHFHYLCEEFRFVYRNIYNGENADYLINNVMPV